MNFRIGEGWDVHALVPGRKLVIGGVEISHPTGLLGHSDADVLLHAITDALLGAAALGDIGSHFPDTAAEFKDADSRVLLRAAYQSVQAAGWQAVNVDTTIIAQAPKLAPYIDKMCASIAGALALPVDAVSVKATTTEGMNDEGRGLCISASAIASLR